MEENQYQKAAPFSIITGSRRPNERRLPVV